MTRQAAWHARKDGEGRQDKPGNDEDAKDKQGKDKQGKDKAAGQPAVADTAGWYLTRWRQMTGPRSCSEEVSVAAVSQGVNAAAQLLEER